MPLDSLEIWRGLRPVVDALDSLGVSWLIGGSVASGTFGISRATQDVDLVADLAEPHAAALAGTLGETYMADESMMAEAIARRGSFNLVHLDTMLKIDVFLAGHAAFAESQMRRRRLVELAGADRRVFMASIEDLVLSKLAWFRDGGGVSERQWLDVQGLLRMNAVALDYDYLRAWARDQDVADLLARAFDDAGLTG